MVSGDHASRRDVGGDVEEAADRRGMLGGVGRQLQPSPL